MRAVRAGARHQFDMALDQERCAGILDRRTKLLDARDHGALVGFLQPQQDGSDIRCREQIRQTADEVGRIVHLRRRKI